MSRVGWIRIAVVATAIGMLEFCCRLGLIDHRVVIPPSEMADALVRLLISGQANDQIVRTFGIVGVAAMISVVAGFALGVVIHALPRARQALDPFFATYYAVPIFILLPGDDRDLRALDHADCADGGGDCDRGDDHRNLERARPRAASALQGVSYAFIGVIASEFILAPAGLGRVISDAYTDFNNRQMYALMLLLIIVATVVNMLLHVVDQRWAERRGIGKP